MKKLLTTLCAVVCLSVCLNAQNITVQSALGQMPGTFIQNNLLGGGVYVFNAKFANSQGPIAVDGLGTFNANGYGGLQMMNGIVMTTGNINLAVGPNDMSSASDAGTNYTDPEMNAVATSQVTGCSTLDFDFVSLSNFVSFNYCFGSEEYPEYVCSSFNDVFAFFLTGPDPETGEEVTRNIALIPGSDTVVENGIAVAINSVNPGQAGSSGGGGTGCYYDYTAYYMDNSLGDPYGGGNNDGVQYDGLTNKMTAQAAIVPCQVYHMHISICNVSDNAFDSGVFLEGGSFTAPTAAIGLSVPGVQQVHGSCPYQVPLTLSQTDFDEGTVHFTYGGTAVYGVDYELVDENGNVIDSLGLYIDNDTHSFAIRGLQSADLSQPKTIELYLATSLCAAFPQLQSYDTIRFNIDRGGDVHVADSTINCTHACFEIGTRLIYGDNVSYRWEPTTGIDDPYSLTSTAMILESRDYHLIATGGSGCNSDTALVRVVITGSNPDIPVNIDEVEGGSISVYPNPAGEVIYIDATGVQRVEVYTVEGRKVFEQVYNNYSGTLDIPTEGMEAGVYGIRISTAEGMQGAKIVVNK